MTPAFGSGNFTRFVAAAGNGRIDAGVFQQV
jgi:hypothetical protein